MSLKRRDFLKLMGVGAGAALAGSTVIEALAAPDLPAPLRAPAAAEARDPIWHALNRLTNGPRPGQVEAVKKMGLQAFIEQQLAPEFIDDSESEKRLGDYITLDMTAVEMLNAGKQPREIIVELDSATILRAIFSERQLYEVMVQFWSEHFNIWHPKEQCKILKTIDDREVIRKFALGKFRDLLGASAKSGAMLIYLDNAKSNKQHPNENYARELMELHTVTIGNYTEDDVKEVARAFTGWTVQGARSPNAGEFLYAQAIHDDGAKKVLGTTLRAGGGINDGETVLDLLAAHPATARHIASKLARRFIADDPPESVIKAAAEMFQKSGGDIKAVLRTIFAAPEFTNAVPKFKRPWEYLISLYRTLDVQLNTTLRPGVLTNFKQMGHLPFDYITPDGPNDYAISWVGNMLPRWNAAIQAAYGMVPGSRVDLIALANNQGVEMKTEPILAYFATHLLGRAFSKAENDAILTFVKKFGDATTNPTSLAGRRVLTDAVALMAASPAFQYR